MILKNIGRKKTIKCWSITSFTRKYEYGCGYSTSMINHYDYSMNRVYVKDKNSLKGIGYYCKKCGKIITDKEYKELQKLHALKENHEFKY